MMRLCLLSPTLFLLAISSFASSVTVACDPPGQTVVGTDQAQCSLLSPGIGSASASLGLELATDPAAFSILPTAQAVSAAINSDGLAALARTEIHFDEFLITAGSVRPGYLILQASSPGSFSESPDGAGGGVGFQFPAYAKTGVSCFALDRQCFPVFSGPHSVTLGTPLELVANGGLSANAKSGEGGVNVAETGRYEFRFVEADGFTPVAVSQTPEPASALLVSAAAVAALIVRKRLLVAQRYFSNRSVP